MPSRLTLSPKTFKLIADLALASLTLIVFTGAAVRLTGSGLGCPDWPQCYGKAAPPLETHAVIEFGNRMLSGLVGFAALGAGIFAWLRRPFRRDLALLGLLLPLGVVGQAVLGGFTVRSHLAPGFVMGHYGLSMLILIAAVALAWRARFEPDQLVAKNPDRLLVRATYALLPLTAVTIFLGTASTAAGPHAGGAGTGDEIKRLQWKGLETLDWAIHRHGQLATVLGVALVAVWIMARRRRATPEHQQALTVSLALVGLQGAVGFVQYALELPAELVWVHVCLATCTWVTLLWSSAVSGRPGVLSARLHASSLVGHSPAASTSSDLQSP